MNAPENGRVVFEADVNPLAAGAGFMSLAGFGRGGASDWAEAAVSESQRRVKGRGKDE